MSANGDKIEKGTSGGQESRTELEKLSGEDGKGTTSNNQRSRSKERTGFAKIHALLTPPSQHIESQTGRDKDNSTTPENREPPLDPCMTWAPLNCRARRGRAAMDDEDEPNVKKSKWDNDEEEKME